MTLNKNFLDEYVDNTSLQGESFTIDSAEVHTFIFNLIAHNEESESGIKIHEEERNGINDWKALKSYYEGMGVYTNDITKADLDLKTLSYKGEKKPTIWWVAFERRLSLV